MSHVAFNLNERVRLSDRREGFVLGMFFPGKPPQGERPPDTVTVMTDDYVEVECWPWQATKIRRTRGQTVKSKDSEGSFYPVELENSARLRMAIWHDHWDTCGVTRMQEDNLEADERRGVLTSYSQYLKEYRGGNKAPLPAREDIRGPSTAPPQKPKQLSMF